MFSIPIFLTGCLLLSSASCAESNSSEKLVDESSSATGRQFGFGGLPGAYQGLLGAPLGAGPYPPTSFGSYPASPYPSYGVGAGYPGQALTPLASYPGASPSIYQNQHGAGQLPGAYAPNLNPYGPQGAYYPSSGSYRPPSGGLNPTNLYNPAYSPSAGYNPAYSPSVGYNPAYSPSVGYNPSGSYNNAGLYPANSFGPSSFPYKPVSPVVSGQNTYPGSAIIPDPFSFQGPNYSPSVGTGYNPSSVGSSYSPSGSQQPYKPIVIEAGYNTGSYGGSSYSPASAQQYKPITVIDSQYGGGSNSYKPSSSSGSYEGYDSITITANPYGSSSSYKPSSVYNSPSSYGSGGYKPSSNRPVIQASIQEIPNTGPLFYSNLKSDSDSNLKESAPASSSQVAFPDQ